MRRAIIHIGMPRTGSTSFQEVLARLRPRLAEVGVLYPELAPPGSAPAADVNHQPLGEALDGRRPRPERARALDRLAQTLAATQADVVILSYEDFSVQRPAFRVPETLATVLARHGFAMEAAITVKPPLEFLNSAYAHRAQLVQETGTFRDYARAHWRSARLDYDGLIAPWARAAGDRVTAIPLRDRRDASPLVPRMAAALGIHGRIGPLLDVAALHHSTNRSPGPIAVEASRRLRRRRVHRQFPGHPRLIGHVLDAAAWSRGLDPEPFLGEAGEMRARIEERVAPLCERFARRVWGAPWSAIVGSGGARAPNELGHRPIPPETDAQVAELVREVAAHFGFRAPPPWRRLPAEWADGAATVLSRRAGWESRWRVQ